MDEFYSAMRGTVLHIIEILACFGIAYLGLKLFGQYGGVQEMIVGLVLAAGAKFARANENIPVSDYTRVD